MNITQEILSDIVVYNKYAKYLPKKQRRETWKELVTRNKEMHQAKFPKLKEEIEIELNFFSESILPEEVTADQINKLIKIIE